MKIMFVLLTVVMATVSYPSTALADITNDQAVLLGRRYLTEVYPFSASPDLARNCSIGAALSTAKTVKEGTSVRAYYVWASHTSESELECTARIFFSAATGETLFQDFIHPEHGQKVSTSKEWRCRYIPFPD